MSPAVRKNFLLALLLTGLVALSHHLTSKISPAPIPTTPTFTPHPTQTTSPHPPSSTPISPTKTATSSPTETPPPLFYTVQEGDTLSKIASQFGLSAEDLALINHISDTNLIYTGQILFVSKAPITIPEATIPQGKQIIVILSSQRAYAFENGQLLKEFTISSGVASYPTVTGAYQIYLKYDTTRMTGPGYDIPDVPWVMYFYRGYGFHGAPWNHHLGTPASHGCINMTVEDAKWLYDWTPLDTLVLILP